MSHLPLDARAILQHLNELGYRNISAEQLREFLKGMQPQSDKQSAIKSKFATTTTTTAAATRANTQQQHQPEQEQQSQPHKNQRSKVKVIKSKRPLCHFKFYLDICDHQLTKRIEADIKALGGSLEFFLNDSITHFITDKEKSSLSHQQHQQQQQTSYSHPGTPTTPATPTALNEDGNGSTPQLRKGRQTRADAILNRARGLQSSSTAQPIPTGNPITPSQQQQQRRQQSLEEKSTSNKRQVAKLPTGSYTVWQTEYALRFLQRIQTELRSYIQGGAAGPLQAGNPTTAAGNIQLKKNFIKIESIKRNHRPYYHLLKQQEEWPKIDLCSEDGAFRLTAKADVQSMTRKSQVGSRTSQRQQDKEKEKDRQQQLQPQVLPLPVQADAQKKPLATVHPAPDTLKAVTPHCRELKESSDKQCGVCEICKVEYDILTIHLQSKDHELFAKNAQNFLALDTLIQVSASVESFLEREEKEQQQKEQQYMKEHNQQQQQQQHKDKLDKIETDSDMEVDERQSDSAIAITITSTNPDASAKNNCRASNNNNNNSNSNNNNNNNRPQRPSPALREKSKRITKGKHSSEKFQATPNSPVNPQTPSPTKKVLPTLNQLDQNQPLKPSASNNAITQSTPNTTRRKTMNSVLSPPFRAMLPPSSLYKVVEASDVMNTPTRGARGGRGAANAGGAGGNVTESPSLIVKFQKVRQSELQRLNGEAENFMFPRTNTRSSSEIPTDVDRQTTSDIRGHHSIASSGSLDTTSEADVSACSYQPASSTTPARTTAVGRRRKGSTQAAAPPSSSSNLSAGSSSTTTTTTTTSGTGGGVPQQQRFPTAPIQPEMQPQSLRPRPAAATTATRKSSRTATAIVTAATTSSQLQLRRQRGGKLEDRMGEQAQTTTTTTANTKRIQLQLSANNKVKQEEEEEEEDDEESNESSCSSGSDEDYIGNLSKSTIKTNCVDTREERAARRLLRLTLSITRGGASDANKSQTRSSSSAKQHKPTPAAAVASHKKGIGTPKSTAPPVTNDLLFDCSKSERLLKTRYEFEKLPTSDLWHRVFQRQDAGEEQYYCYYGSTRYRKLPYEQGPIPMELTMPHTCTLCHQHVPVKKELDEPMEQLEQQQLQEEEQHSNSNQMVYKHKKLHLLQRYQQQQQHQQQETAPPPGALKSVMPMTAKCDSKASTPELLERDLVPLSERAQIVERVRATSTQSSSSSSCSNSQKSSSRHKQLARLVDLPPRKSPREHASTLALVSCIIRQRQDSQSKTNSEAEEPPVPIAATPNVKLPLKQEPTVSAPPPSSSSPAASTHNTRLQTATPVEEMRFATEISETVKRMRRGQNKYDTLPARVPTPVRSRRPAAVAAAAAAASSASAPSAPVSYSRRLQLAKREASSNSNVILGKRKRRHNATLTPTMRPTTQQQTPGMTLLAGVRKLPSKKGLLEYEMEKSALNKLNESMKFVNPMLIAWEIDKYLELTGQEYDLIVDDQQLTQNAAASSSTLSEDQVQTPPSTDCYFTSEFDLCDLLLGDADSGDDEALVGGRTSLRRNNSFNLFAGHQRKRKCLKSNRTGWPRVQRRRGVANTRLSIVDEASSKDTQQMEVDSQQQHYHHHHHGRHHGIKEEPLETEEEQTTTTTTTTMTTTSTTRTTKSADKELCNQQEDDNDDAGANADDRGGGGDKELPDKEHPACEDTAMTPPATDVDEQVVNDEEIENTDDNDEAASAAEENESQVGYDDEDTMADLVENQNSEAEIEATDADVEDDAEDDEDDVEDDDDDDDEDVYEDAYGDDTKETHDPLAMDQEDISASYTNESELKQDVQHPTIPKSQYTEDSPEKKPLLTMQTTNRYCLNVTSTPSTQSRQQQQQRRTPQLNGSLESCISPSEKLGDNSDIFTVSSDGLDTDMDLSNTQAGDSLEQQQQQTTPKRKFDISKYAPPKNGKAASSCAAEAATAAVKSLAISQFLKKEVRVTCRRLRAPFRRFRYRR